MSNEQSLDDYGEYAQKQVTPLKEAMIGLNALVTEAQGYEREIAEAEEKAKAAKDKLRAVVMDALPKAMKAAGLTEFTTEQGLVVRHRDKIENSIPANRRNDAWDWLEKNGHADIVKREVTIAFGVKEAKAAQECAEALAKAHMRSVACERWAEPATVKALLTRLIEERKSVPRDIFGVREFAIAEFKEAKKK
ncbi:MAG: hypothetical protein IT435_02445 [Phycisphaerales bacterium]|nr:hypothetical protein [Phycisphaerales bacterium]